VWLGTYAIGKPRDQVPLRINKQMKGLDYKRPPGALQFKS